VNNHEGSHEFSHVHMQGQTTITPLGSIHQHRGGAVFTGLVGTGGALRGLALAALRVPKSTFVALSAAIDLGGDTVRSLIYIKSGLFQWNHWFYIPALMLAALLGSIVGKWALSQISQRLFERLVAVFVFLSGLLFLIAPD
jgi:uncharacterized membrane protein YfcA